MRIRKTWGVLGALGIVVSGVVVEAASGGFTAQPVSVQFSGTVDPTQIKHEVCTNPTSHEDHGTFTAVVGPTTDTTGTFLAGDVITIHTTTLIDDSTGGEGYTVGDVQVDRTVQGKHVHVGDGGIEATNTQEGLLDGFILGHVADNGTTNHRVLAANFWVQFSSNGGTFNGAFGDGPSGPTDMANGYNRDSQQTSTLPGPNDTDNHAVITSGDC